MNLISCTIYALKHNLEITFYYRIISSIYLLFIILINRKKFKIAQVLLFILSIAESLHDGLYKVYELKLKSKDNLIFEEIVFANYM